MSCSISKTFSTSSSKRILSSTSLRSSTNSASQVTLTGDASTVARGTAFEHSSSLLLDRRFGIQLQRVGGAGDRGIDLRGWWYIPQKKDPGIKSRGAEDKEVGRRRRLRIIAQCKAEAKKLGPVIIREFEGTLHRAELQDRSSSRTTSFPSEETQGSEPSPEESDFLTDSRIIGVLLSASGFSKQSALQALSSPSPLLLIHLEAPDQTLHSSLIRHFEQNPFNFTQINDVDSKIDSPDSPPLATKRTRKRKKKLKESQGKDQEVKLESSEPLERLETPVLVSAMANQALLSKLGPLQGRMEIRWERNTNVKESAAGDGPILYWDGKKVEGKDVDKTFKG